MPIFKRKIGSIAPCNVSFLTALGVTALVVAMSPLGPNNAAYAFDGKEKAKAGVTNSTILFKFGFSAYRKGQKEEAVEAYRDAAEEGHAGAQWKLARMYADGDGVEQNHRRAFEIFEQLVRLDARPGSQEGIYVSDAHMALAHYLSNGVSESNIPQNLNTAKALKFRAASYFGNPSAQFEIARELLAEPEVKRGHLKQATRWLKLSMKKGHAGAEALLGRLYFDSGRAVRGLAMMTSAMRKARPSERQWIRSMHEKAFASADEAERRTSIALSEELAK